MAVKLVPINPDKIVIMDEAFYTPRVDIYDKDNKGPVVQLGVTLKHFTGDLYVKVEHLEYIARERLEMVSKEGHDAALRELREANEKNEALSAELNKIREEEQNGFNERLGLLFANYLNGGLPNDDHSPVANASDLNAGEDLGSESLLKGKASKSKDISLDGL